MKKIALAILALVVITVTTAFAWQPGKAAKKNITDYAYFEYQGTDPSGENDEQNWMKVAEGSTTCLDETGVLCTILAPIANPSDNHPDFSGIDQGDNVRTSELITYRTFKQQ